MIKTIMLCDVCHKKVKAEDLHRVIVKGAGEDQNLDICTDCIEAFKDFVNISRSPVVHCKNCEYHTYCVCKNPNGITGYVTDNDFCSYGVTKQEDE